MKTETRTITFGAAAIAVVASFLAGAYMADGYRTPPARTFGVSDAVAAPEALPGPKATSAPAANSRSRNRRVAQPALKKRGLPRGFPPLKAGGWRFLPKVGA